MILRRVIEHVKAQNWTAVALDFVIVVVGVFIGIQVSNWNAARGERAAEAGYLEAMEQDVAYSIQNLETMIDEIQRQEAARAALYQFSLDPDAALAPAERDRLVLIALFQLRRLDISQTTFESLKSAGRLGLIRSPTLLSELQALSAEIANAIRSQDDEEEITYLFSDPMLVSEFEMDSVFIQTDLSGERRLQWLKTDIPERPTPEIMKTRAFRNALLYRSVFTEGRLTVAESMLKKFRHIGELIDERQSALGEG